MKESIAWVRSAWADFWADRAMGRRFLAERIENDWYGNTEGAPVPKGSMTEWQIDTNRALADLYDSLGGTR